MAHIPYGYKIKNGKAVVDEEKAAVVKKLFENYAEGFSLKSAAVNSGLNICHGSAGRMLRNTHYLGDDYYPAIIEKELFDKAEKMRISRAAALGRIRKLKPIQKPNAETKFKLNSVPTRFIDSFEQAEFIYSQIECEVTDDE